MNNFILFAYYFWILGLIIANLILAQGLSNRFKKKYLNSLLYFLIFSSFYTFLIYVVPDLLVFARGESISARNTSTYYLCNFFAFPLAVIYEYFFICFFFELENKKIPFSIRYGFLIVGFMLMIPYGYGLNLVLRTGSSAFFRLIYNVIIRLLFTVSGYACFIYAFINAKTLSPIHWCRAVRIVCGYYVVAFLIQMPLPFLSQSEVVFYVRPFYFIALNLPVLIYLDRFLSTHAQAELLAVNNSEKLRLLFEEYSISRREQEVFLLLFSGCSNKEIEEKLYISLRTVKSHVYNVYQKFGVNSRLKLASLVLDRLKDGTQVSIE